MHSSGFRRLTGVIVTALVVLLIILSASTLLRYPMGERAQVGAGDAATAAATHPAETPIPTPTTAPTTLGAPATVDPAAAIALTLQPTPTRVEPVVLDTPTPSPTASPTPLPGLPTPDPDAPPTGVVLVYANPNWVNDLTYAAGALWAATSGGAIRWNVADGTVQRYGTDDGMGATMLTSVTSCPIRSFGLVFGSDHGLQVVDTATEEWKHIAGGGAALRNNDVSAVACDAQQGVLAVGYLRHGVDIYRGQPGRWTHFEPGDGFAEEGVQALAVADNGVVWAASGGSLSQLQGSRVRTITPEDSPLTGEVISDLAVDADNALWLTSGERLYRLSGTTWEHYSANRADGDFPGGTLAGVAPAQGGRVWVASADAAVCRFDPEFGSCVPFYADAPGMAPGPLTALAVGDGGAVAYGTRGQGSSVFTRSQWNTLALTDTFPVGNRIFALASDAHGFVWAATNGGVHQFDPGNPAEVNALYTATTEGITATNVRSLFADARGGVWLGGIGASYFDGGRWTNYTQADGLAGDEITAIAEDSQRRVWFGTRTGLSIWTGTTFFNLTGENGLPDAEILSLAAAGDGMWIGSASGGLYRFENNQLQVLTRENVGLPSNRITALLVHGGRLVVGTDRGLGLLENNVVQIAEALTDQRISSLAAGGDGLLWVGTLDSGAFTSSDGEAWQPAGGEEAALPTSVRALAVDLYGGAWLGADASGLVRVQPE